MFYLKNDVEIFESIVLAETYNLELPYLIRSNIKLNTVLKLANAEVKSQKEHYLFLNPEIATWCYLDPDEYGFCKYMLTSIRYSKLKRHSSISDDRLKEFLYHLYHQGMLLVNGRLGIDQSIYDQGPLFRDVFMLELMLTEKCNLQCEYCFAETDSEKGDMTPEIGKRAIDKMLELPFNRFIIKFEGGEPLLKLKLLTELAEYATRKNSKREKPAEILFEITTNGTLIDEETLAILRFYRIRINVSLDGLPESHDKARYFPNRSGSHEKIVDGINKLVHRKMAFRVITVVGKHNLNQVESTLKYYDSLGIQLTRFNPMIRVGRGDKSWEKYSISPEEYFFFMRAVVEYMGKNSSFKEDNVESMVRNLILKTRDFRCMRSPCGAGILYLNVDPKGNIHPCAYYRSATRNISLGNVYDHTPFSSCYRNQPLIKDMARRTVNRIPECEECLWRHWCEGGCSFGAYLKNKDLKTPCDLCSYYNKMYPFLIEYLFKNPDLACYLVFEASVIKEHYFKSHFYLDKMYSVM